MKKKFPLTKSGKGIQVEIANLAEIHTEEVESWISEYSFVVFKRLDTSIEKLKGWISQFGELVNNKRRINENVLILDGSKDSKEVIGGKGRMPLHCDGLLMGEKVRLVAILGVDCDLINGGRTYISDSEQAWERIPQNIKEVAREKGIEILPCDKDYFVKNEHQYYHFPGIQYKNERPYLNVGMHYHLDEEASWRIRFQGIDEDLSYKYYSELESIYESEDLTYFHQWETGDLLLMDNVRVMHGREAFQGKRVISQFQVREK